MNRRIHPSYRRDPCCGSGCDRAIEATVEKPCWGQVDMVLPSRDHRCEGHRQDGRYCPRQPDGRG